MPDGPSPYCTIFGALLAIGATSMPASAGTGEALAASRHPCLAMDLPDPVFVKPDELPGIFADKQGGRYSLADVLLRTHLPTAVDATLMKAIAAGPENRWGERPAWVLFQTNGRWTLLQEQILREGHGLFAPEHGRDACAAALWMAERKGEAAANGLWSSGKTSPVKDTREPGSFEGSAGDYVIARGPVVSLGKTRRTRYLNFGTYWKADVTATIANSEDELFSDKLQADGASFAGLAGTNVEIRGFVQMRDGPLLELVHPDQFHLVAE